MSLRDDDVEPCLLQDHGFTNGYAAKLKSHL